MPDYRTLDKLKEWAVSLVPYMKSPDYRSKNNEKIRLEMRTIVHEESNVRIDINDAHLDLIIDFLIQPYLNK